ncbi:MAG: hypothetical protein WCK98_01915 [bacterium]
MTYTVKLSKKNQGAIPVEVLRKLDLVPNQENSIIIFQNLTGDFIVATPQQMLAKLKGSLGKKVSGKVKAKLPKMTMEEILIAEKNAKNEYFRAKYTNRKI